MCQPKVHSPKSRLVGDDRVAIDWDCPGDVSSAEMKHSAPLVSPLGRERLSWGKSCLGWIHHMQIRRTLWGSVQGSCIS